MTRKLIAVILIAAAVVVIGLQFFLAYGLTNSLRKWVLPVIKERYCADISVDNLSVNLLGGSMNVNDIKIANPSGFDEPTMLFVGRCGLKVGLPALFKSGCAEIQKAVLKDVDLAVIRNSEGALNLAPIISAMRSSQENQAEAAPSAPSTPTAGQNGRKTLPNFIIKKLEIISRLNYLDSQINPREPFKLGLEANLLLNNIANYGADDSLSGAINLHGNLLENDKKCAFELNGRISPLTDPLSVSFDLAGSMQAAGLKNFKGLIESIGLKDGKVSATANLVCRKGQFDREKSVIRLKFSEIILAEDKAEKMKGIPLPSSFDVLVPVSGPLSNPQINVAEAFVKTITSEAMVDSIIKGIVDSKKLTGDNLKGGQKDSDSGSSPAKELDGIKGIFDGLTGGREKK